MVNGSVQKLRDILDWRLGANLPDILNFSGRIWHNRDDKK